MKESTLAERLAELLHGQPGAIRQVVPYVEMHQSGLAPEGRPAGVFMLLGPTGTGKTHTVEALAEVLHGSQQKVLRIDCGEFQMDHEVAKLTGSPPGYLGHRETQPLLSQSQVNGICSDECDLSLLLFDEIEKSAPSMTRLLFGILDKATLRLGDNSRVDFERCLIFLTSNLGAENLSSAPRKWGFEGGLDRSAGAETIALKELRKKFGSPFVNRLDEIVTYQPLSRSDCDRILTKLLAQARELIQERLGWRAFRLLATPDARNLLLDQGTSIEFGARELKRAFERNVMRPIVTLVSQGAVPPNGWIVLAVKQGQFFVGVEGGRAWGAKSKAAQ